MNRRTNDSRRGRGLLRAPLALVFVAALAGCDELLDVENPNQLVQEDLETPAAAGALANGAVATVAQAYARMVLIHDAASDELQFVGSRDAWIQLQRGDLRDPANEFTDQVFPYVTEARWMADEAIRLLSEFEAEGQLGDPVLLARAQLYSAVIYTFIADLFEDFAFSDRMEEAPPVGPANMVQLYDTAIENLNGALSRAQAAGDSDLEARVLAQRARTRHARGVWETLNPAGSVPDNPLVHDASAVADAEAVLAQVDPDWRFLHTYSSATVTNWYGSWVNERLELRVSNEYAIPTGDDKEVAAIRLEDPIDGVPDPALTARINEVAMSTVRGFGPVTVTSAREMRLILAEAALAQGDEAGFAAHINAVRARDELTPWSGQIPAVDMLIHARRVNLFNQGRRLLDHYRFGEPSFLWGPSQEATTRPGTRFPITNVELRANCHILGTC